MICHLQKTKYRSRPWISCEKGINTSWEPSPCTKIGSMSDFAADVFYKYSTHQFCDTMNMSPQKMMEKKTSKSSTIIYPPLSMIFRDLRVSNPPKNHFPKVGVIIIIYSLFKKDDVYWSEKEGLTRSTRLPYLDHRHTIDGAILVKPTAPHLGYNSWGDATPHDMYIQCIYIYMVFLYIYISTCIYIYIHIFTTSIIERKRGEKDNCPKTKWLLSDQIQILLVILGKLRFFFKRKATTWLLTGWFPLEWSRVLFHFCCLIGDVVCTSADTKKNAWLVLSWDLMCTILCPTSTKRW